MDREIEEMKKSYKNVEIPDELDLVIKTAIKKGEAARRMSALRKMAATVAAVLLLAFTAGINLSPAFAETIGSIPGASGLVKILQFNRGSVTGGEVTDGKQVGPVTREEDQDVAGETITIPIYQDGIPAGTAVYFEVRQNLYPHSIIIDLHGIRFSSTTQPDFTGSKVVTGMHKLILLDDAAERYTILFNGPVDLVVKETSDPASIVIEITEASAQSLAPVYSVRTASYPFGETIGAMEEMINEALDWQADTVRMLPDVNGNLTVEAGYFGSEAEAQSFIESLLDSGAIDFNLYIEKRSSTAIPSVLTE